MPVLLQNFYDVTLTVDVPPGLGDAFFDLEQRVFQLSAMKTGVPPLAVFNRDQVPLHCSAAMATTVSARGEKCIWNVMWIQRISTRTQCF